MLFHRFQAWNLAHAIYMDPAAGARHSGFVEHRFEQGFTEGWIRPAMSRDTLEMFVLDDTPLLPGDLDIDPRPLKGHLRWYGDIAPDLSLRAMGRYCLPEVRALKGQVLSNLRRRRFDLSGDDFDRITAGIEQIPENFRWAVSSEMLHEIELEFSMASLTMELARRGIPTYAFILPQSQNLGAPADPVAPPGHEVLVAKFYFENQVQVPSPSTFTEAIRLRENDRIQAWRTKVRSWSDALQSGSTKFEDIKQEIDDANSYILGAGFPLRLVPRWSAFFTLPMAYYHTFTNPNELSHMFGYFLFAVESVHVFGELISQAVKSPDPLEYKWLLVSNNE